MAAAPATAQVDDQVQEVQATDNKQEITKVAEAGQDHEITEVTNPNLSQQENVDSMVQQTVQPPTQTKQPGEEPQQVELNNTNEPDNTS